MKGGFSKASNFEIAASQECVARLKELILGHILRRMKNQLRFECALPERKENIVFCPLTDSQLELYELYVSHCKTVFENGGNGYSGGDCDDAKPSG